MGWATWCSVEAGAAECADEAERLAWRSGVVAVVVAQQDQGVSVVGRGMVLA